MDYSAPIREGLASIGDLLDELQPVAALSWDQDLADRGSRRIAERLVGLLVEACADVARMYLLQARRSPGSSKAEALRELANLRVLPRDVADELGNYAHVRNILAHTYRGTDDQRVYDLIRQGQSLFVQFVAAMESALPPSSTEGSP